MKYCPFCRTALALRYLGERERPACPAPDCDFVHWGNPTPVVAGIIQREAGFILARNAAWPTGVFSMITGFLEQDETPEDCIRRETYEELGLHAGRVDFLGHHKLPRRNQLIIAYLVQTTGEVMLSEEIIEVQYLTRRELEQYNFGAFKLVPIIVQQALAINR